MSICRSLLEQVRKGGCVEAAVSDAAEKHDVSKRMVWDIWKEYAKPRLEILKSIAAKRAALQTNATYVQPILDDN
jgi:hypothetical protein